MTLPYISGHIPLQESQQSAVIELNKATKLDACPRTAPQPEPYARATFLRAMEMHVDEAKTKPTEVFMTSDWIQADVWHGGCGG